MRAFLKWLRKTFPPAKQGRNDLSRGEFAKRPDPPMIYGTIRKGPGMTDAPEPLTPCPFCGYDTPTTDLRGNPWVWCPGCDAEGPCGRDVAHAVELWDARADTTDRLAAESEVVTTYGIAEIAARNPSVMEYMQHWEGRAERAEAENERMREALKWYATLPEEWRVVTGPNLTYGDCFLLGETARAALQEEEK